MAQADPICASSILACGLRVTLLDSLGNVADQENNYYVTNNLISIAFTPEIETGSDRTLKSGCDCIIATAKFPDLLKRFTFQIDLGQMEPALVALMTGGTLVTDDSDIPVPIGWNWPIQISCSDTPPPKVAVEVWSDVWENDHQNAILPYWHWVFPLTQWQIGPSKLDSDFAPLALTGYSLGSTQWVHGPYGDPVAVGQLGAVWQEADGPPTAECAYGTVVPAS